MTDSALIRTPPQSSAVATPCDSEPSQGDFRSRIGGGTGEPTAEATYARFGDPFPQSNPRSHSAVSAETTVDVARALRDVFGPGVKLFMTDDLERVPRFGVKPEAV